MILSRIKHLFTRASAERRRRIAAFLDAIEAPLTAGDTANAELACAQASAALDEFSATARSADDRKFLAAAFFDLGSFYRRLRNKDLAVQTYARSTSVLSELVNQRKHAQFARGQLAACENHLGLLYLDEGPLEKAQEHFDQAIQLREQLLERYPDDGENKVYLAGALCNRGHVARDAGDKDLAKQFYQRSIAMVDAALPECDCDQQEAIAMMISKMTNRPHWILLAYQFRQNASKGLESIS